MLFSFFFLWLIILTTNGIPPLYPLQDSIMLFLRCICAMHIPLTIHGAQIITWRCKRLRCQRSWWKVRKWNRVFLQPERVPCFREHGTLVGWVVFVTKTNILKLERFLQLIIKGFMLVNKLISRNLFFVYTFLYVS